ncbi:MAG: EamA family transporter [Thermaerobacter sp.]|jgi:drug/metabolite transporter (DMT)-like permease|nr:EamA family transporter [Thermaerobacter sp.]MDA8145723.1 EamA family transporter [Thermaerobacter sp.]
MPLAAFIAGALVLGATGQLLLKAGVDQVGHLSVGPRLFDAAFQPLVLAGFLCYGVSALLWLVVLSRSQLSFAYPLLAINYVLLVLLSAAFLGESLSWPKLAGSLIVGLGVFVLTR